MITDLNELFPQSISDETAYQLSEFFMALALKIESHYYSQIIRYIRENRPDDFDDGIVF